MRSLRCTVNVRGPAVSNAHIAKGWADEIVTDILVRPNEIGDYLTPQACYEVAKGCCQKLTGIYTSMRLHEPGSPDTGGDATCYPPASLSIDTCPEGDRVKYPTTGDRQRWWPDIRKPEVLELAALRLAVHCTSYQSDIILVDNVIRDGDASADPCPFEYEHWCNFLNRLQVLMPDRRVIANTASSWVWPVQDVELALWSTWGLAFELPVHPSIRGKHKELKDLMEVYHKFVRDGKYLILMHVTPAGTSVEEQHKESAYMAAFAMMLIDGSDDPNLDNVYVHSNYRSPNPPWQNWREKFGKPLSEPKVSSNGTIERTFANGTITLSAPREVDARLNWDAFTAEDLTEYRFDGGLIHRNGKTFRREIKALKSHGPEGVREYSAPCVIAPGTDADPFIFEFDEPGVLTCGFLGTCPPGQPGLVIAQADTGVGDNSGPNVAAPFFHRKAIHPPLVPGPLRSMRRVEVNVEGPVNNAWISLPNGAKNAT